MNPGSSKKVVVRRKIRFLLDGEVIELENVDPTRTVLQYLREDIGHCGTKEGCAEGDCGACTVVLVDAHNSRKQLRARAVNACIQFLPTLDGKELLTIESLADADGTLHPVQQAMVDCHGSQCGFCTPGFVMSLFALYKNRLNPSRREIDDALAGNLCRCTGYQPIVMAAAKMYDTPATQRGWITSPGPAPGGDDEISRLEALASLASDRMLVVEQAEDKGRRFFAPRRLQELALLCERYPDAVLLAGGTDVGLWVTKQHREIATTIYTGNVAELASVDISPTHIELGAAVSLTDAMSVILDYFPALQELFLRFASPPIRNAATLGGNIANGSPIGDSMPALLVLDAVLLLRHGSGTRPVALSDFYLGYQETALDRGEFIEKILLPLPVSGEQLASYKVSKRFDQDISALCAAFRLMLDGDRVADIKIAFGGMAEVPKRATICEEALRGKLWSADTVREIAGVLKHDFTPISDMRASADYRERVAENLLLRFVNQNGGHSEPGIYRYGR